jgi:hypothetical protein
MNYLELKVANMHYARAVGSRHEIGKKSITGRN